MPIELFICTGDTCSLLGASEVLNAARKLPAVGDGRVTVGVRHCFAKCHSEQPLCPSVRIGRDVWIDQATPAKLKAEVERQLRLPKPVPPPGGTPPSGAW